MRVSSVSEVRELLLLLMMMIKMAALRQATSVPQSECSDDITRYIARHVDVTYEVLANYDDGRRPASSTRRLRGRFNLTNGGPTTVRRGRWEIYLSSIRRMQLTENATMLGNSGLKARIVSEHNFTGECVAHSILQNTTKFLKSVPILVQQM